MYLRVYFWYRMGLHFLLLLQMFVACAVLISDDVLVHVAVIISIMSFGMRCHVDRETVTDVSKKLTIIFRDGSKLFRNVHKYLPVWHGFISQGTLIFTSHCGTGKFSF